MRRSTSEVKTALENLIEAYAENPNLLWEIPISPSSTQGAIPSRAYIAEKANATTNQLNKYPDFEIMLRELMVTHGVIVKDKIASALEIRRNMHQWWKLLSVEQKSNLEIFGNKIQFRKYIPNFRGGKNYEIVAEFAETLNGELLASGVLDNNYVPVKDRAELRDSGRYERANDKRQFWDDLSHLPLDNESDLLEVNDKAEPYIQVSQLFAAKLKTIGSESNRSNYLIAHKHFIDFLRESSIPEHTPLQGILHEFLLTRFKKDYLLPKIDSREVAPLSASTILSCLRSVLNRAKKIKGLGFDLFYDEEGFNDVGRITDMYRPYSVNERLQINKAITSDISEIKTLMEPYVESRDGEYPLDENYHIVPGKSSLANARYLFENHLDSRPVFYNNPRNKYGEAFLRMIKSTGQNLHAVYKDWGVLPYIDISVIAPFILRFAQVTGMNSDSVCLLTIDDFNRSHRLTNRPCITYWKERSTGEKEYHLDIFKAELQWLTVSQAKEVQDIFDTVIALTQSIRGDAPEGIAQRLFLYKSTGNAVFGKIMAVDSLVNYFNTYAEKHSITSDDGKLTQLNIARFRPTFVSELLEHDISIREIQLMLGHKYLSTTMNYLDRLDFNRIAQEKIKDALDRIHRRSITPDDKNKLQKHIVNEDRIIFKTPLGGCANIFNPPDFIKNSTGYKENQPCSQYNKCLTCENVMLTASHLVDLFAMRRDYMLQMQNSRVIETPYSVVVEENLALLDEILSANNEQGFSKEDLDRAERLSMFVETNIIDNFGA